jgi:23S rRNA (cytosine1962-C5)-methyltransferase
MNEEYRLLDCGGGRKLERLGPYLLDRPVNYAVWPPKCPIQEWKAAQGHYVRSDKGGGHWNFRESLPESWEVSYGGLTLEIKPTPFGHLGLFPEQRANWQWLREVCQEIGEAPRVLNLFAYSGGSTLAAAQGGARVCHVDSSKGVVQWARKNAALSGLNKRAVRWMVEDAVRFVQREVRRGNKYQGIVMDPPSFGRGARGQIFKIEEHLLELVNACWELLADGPGFFLLSCHSASFTPRVLEQILEGTAPRPGNVESGEMLVSAQEGGADLPSGVFARWRT